MIIFQNLLRAKFLRKRTVLLNSYIQDNPPVRKENWKISSDSHITKGGRFVLPPLRFGFLKWPEESGELELGPDQPQII